jgi:hypothetical protein
MGFRAPPAAVVAANPWAEEKVIENVFNIRYPDIPGDTE